MNLRTSVEISPAYVEVSNRAMRSKKRFFRHQVETMESDSSVIVLDAPTGSGKTLAALARVLDRRSPAVFIYPTNSLVKDQVGAIKELLEDDLGQRVRSLSGDEELDPSSATAGTEEVDLFHMTGESLASLSLRTAKGTIMDRLLKGTHIQNRMRILLTNPDTIYLAFAGWYHRHGEVSAQLATFTTLVIDEFHLYSGPTLARLFYLLNLLRGSPEEPSVQLIFLSATHGDTMRLLQETYPELTVIRVSTSDQNGADWYKIRHQTTCELKSRGRIMLDDTQAQESASDIMSFYDMECKWEKKPPNVKVLGVFSSVTFAVMVAQHVRKSLLDRGIDPTTTLAQIHGLIPADRRPGISELEEAILIGTSAIEVGIDFNVPFLVMEAQDLASFLQRFGRGGRHSACRSILNIPQPAADRMRMKASWSFADFIDEVKTAFKSMPSYAGFLTSHHARRILLALALAGSRRRLTRWQRMRQSDLDAAVELFKYLVKANSSVRIDGTALQDSIDEMDDESIRSWLEDFQVEVMADHGFLRGTMNSVLSKVSLTALGLGSGQFVTEMDLLDVVRLEGHLEPLANHVKSIPKQMRERHGGADHVFIIESIRRGTYPKVSLSQRVAGSRTSRVYQDPDMHLRVPDREMMNVAERLLHRRNLAFYDSSMYPSADYRIPRVPADERPGSVVIGDWALVADYLSAVRKEQEEFG
jgi:CRISPR-associated helicase Cas3